MAKVTGKDTDGNVIILNGIDETQGITIDGIGADQEFTLTVKDVNSVEVDTDFIGPNPKK